jgi:hypothetical protein
MIPITIALPVLVLRASGFKVHNIMWPGAGKIIKPLLEIAIGK